MGAYSYLDTDEYTGGIVFARSNIEARKLGANLLDRDEIAGLEVRRRADLDKYEQTGVPAWLLVAEGWRFECDGCGMQINDCSFEDEGLSVTGIVGIEGRAIYCGHACRMEARAERAARKAFGAAFVDMLQDLVRDRFPDFEHNFGSYNGRSYIPSWSGPPYCVVWASIQFEFPGMKFGPACLRYDHHGPNGQTLIGPVRPEFFCPGGDREAFEAAISGSETEAQP